MADDNCLESCAGCFIWLVIIVFIIIAARFAPILLLIAGILSIPFVIISLFIYGGIELVKWLLNH